MASPDEDRTHEPLNDRPRLPSFSNFLSATGRADLPFDQHTPNLLTINRPASSIDETTLPPPQSDRGPSRESFFNRSYPPQPFSADHSTIGRLSDLVHHPSRNPHHSSISSLTEPFGSPSSIRHSAPARIHGSLPLLEGGRSRLVVGEEMIPGKGLCYRYDDGSICPKTINGDAVNPDWGTTKTGKPRKRLGQACNTCREKKIKCDPSLPKCQQCQKFNRECRFATSSRSSQRSALAQSSRESLSSTTPLTHEAKESKDTTTSLSNSASPHEREYSRSVSKSSIAVDSLLSPPPTDNILEEDGESEAHRATKKLRVYTSSPIAETHRNSDSRHISRHETPNTGYSAMRTYSHFNIDADPFEIEPGLTLHYLSTYFSQFNADLYYILPRKLFMRWFKDNRKKTKWERLLLYAMLALGAIFSKDKESKSYGVIFLEIAEANLGQTAGVFEIQVVLTRLILSAIAFAQGMSSKSWELCGATIRAATGMNLNMEEISDRSDSQIKLLPFDFDFSTLAECKRRTFWAAYIMDSFSGATSGHISSINKSECFLRLPCQEGMYEAGRIQDMPYFHGQHFVEISRQHNFFLEQGLMSSLVQIATTLNDIVNQIHRNKFPLAEKSEIPAEAFHLAMSNQIQQWEKALKKSFLTSPPENDFRGVRTPPETVSGIHLLLHYCAMLLYRHVRPEQLDANLTARNVQGAYNHARKTLEILQRMSGQELKDIPQISFGIHNPITATIATTAIDIITAGGSVTEFLEIQNQSIELVAGGIEVLDVLAEQWQPAEDLRNLVKDRISMVFTACKIGSVKKKKAFFVKDPLISPFGKDLDLTYGLPRLNYLQALGLGKKVITNEDLYEAGG